MKNNRLSSFYAIMLTAWISMGMTSCSESVDDGYVLKKEDISVTQPEGGFVMNQNQLLKITVNSVSDEGLRYEWFINGESVSQEKNLMYMCEDGGNFDLVLKVYQRASVYEYPFLLSVKYDPTEVTPEGGSPYITRVLDYRPAPGQFTNKLPEYVDGDTQDVMNQKVLDAIGYNRNGMISLGSYGGYVVVGFDHTIRNVAGEKDFQILGNAFYATANPRPNAPKGGSCEPGIVMVAYDANKNHRPDDNEWYELAGSEYTKSATIKEYEITYQRNPATHVATPDAQLEWNIDTTNCPWTDNQGQKGYIFKNMFNDHEYYPQWIKENSIKFKGTLLPKNAIDESGKGTYWVLYAFDWGYADNALNAEDGSKFDIAWAVDSKGRPVELPGVDFVKIYTGVNQYCGWLGEVSTEVSGVTDLHLLKK